MADNASTLKDSLVRNVDEAEMRHIVHGETIDVRLGRLAEGTLARKLGATILVLPPGKAGCPYHLHHAQEEMFVILEGEGTLRIAGEHIPLRTGDVIFAPAGPDHPRQILNTSDASMRYLAISTQEDPEICEYPDSGKYMAEGSLLSDKPFEVIQRTGSSLDYWDGEP